jgi:hypothetical protein
MPKAPFFDKKNNQKFFSTNSYGFSLNERKIAEIKLALLKENFIYKEFFRELNEDPYSICQEIRKPNESKDEHYERLCRMENTEKPFFGGYNNKFGVNHKFFVDMQNYEIPLEELLKLLDPKKEISEISSRKLLGMLPMLFIMPGVREIHKAQRVARYGENIQDGWTHLKPYERLLLIDLRKRKSQLIKDFEELIEHELSLKKATNELRETWNIVNDKFSYLLWEPENDRQREETWSQLQVWRLRKQRKSFWWISKELNISEDLAKKRFYRAYEKILGEKYDSEYYRTTILPIKKAELLKTCEDCQDNKCLNLIETEGKWDPCPEILAYINQDQVPLKEKILKEDSDSIKDLISKK